MVSRGLSARALALIWALALTCVLVSALPPGTIEEHKVVEESVQSSVPVEDTSEATLGAFEQISAEAENKEDTQHVRPETNDGYVSMAKSVEYPIKDSSDNLRKQKEETAPKDMIYADHSKWKCFSEPRYTGRRCNSSYAFATIALMEYLYCRQTGELVEFSEQYLIDCGYRMNLGGCNGGDLEQTIKFVWTHGLELQRTYPYRDRNLKCPYPKNTKPYKMGFISIGAKNGTIISRNFFEDYIEKIPILTYISTDRNFFKIGKELRLGAKCSKNRDHAVLLIGHGRKDGVEFWRIKDSSDPDGYYDVAKNSRCLSNRGYLLLSDERTIAQDFKLNKRNDCSIVATENLNRMPSQ